MYVYLDLETTGLNLDGQDEIVEVAITDSDGNSIIHSLVKPVLKTEWPHAQAIHGISPEDVSVAPTLHQISEEIALAIKDKVVAIYNAAYDTKFLRDVIPEARAVECAMLKFAKFYGEKKARGGYKWQKLSFAADHFGHQWTGKAHSALADALACRAVWIGMHTRSERLVIGR